jgi:putative CocE/NonD family hydrolase
VVRGPGWCGWQAGGCAAAAGPATAAAAAPAAPPPDVAVTWGVRIPMRDGVRLNATLYRARGAAAPLPCVFTLTPYISQSYHDRGIYFGSHGYVFLTIDARGRGNSEGDFTPLLQEAKDGHDVVEWLAAQAYCDGKVAMWGGSYAGYDQWATAREFPAHLATIVPVAAPYAGVDFPLQDQMFGPYDIQWLTLVAGRASQSAIFADAPYWASVFKRLYLEHRPFRELDRIAGMPSPIFQTWIAHPEPDAYWDSYNPTAGQYARIGLPILTITGQYDGDQEGALTHYRRHLEAAGPAARGGHFLVIGPWDHAGTRTPQAQFGGLQFGPASLVDMNDLHRAWYDWTMKSGPRPAFLDAPVMYYMAGAEEWRAADSLNGITSGARLLYLDSTAGGAADVFASGCIGAAPGKGAPDQYVYDPLDIAPAWLADDTAAPEYTDQRAVVLNRGGSLIYHSAPFAADTEVAGFFRLTAHIALDQKDTDLTAAVYAIAPDGGSVLLATDARRARYRDDPRVARLVTPGRVERYEFDSFTFVARTIGRGHRLRLVIGPANTPFAQKNYNAGGRVSDESGADARPVTVRLYHDDAHASILKLPLARPRAR